MHGSTEVNIKKSCHGDTLIVLCVMSNIIDLSAFVCLTESCRLYRKQNTGNIKVHYIKKAKCGNILYLKCTDCGKKFSENKGTIFYRKKTNRETIVKVLKSVSEGMGIRPAGRYFNKNKNTIFAWRKLNDQYTDESSNCS